MRTKRLVLVVAIGLLLAQTGCSKHEQAANAPAAKMEEALEMTAGAAQDAVAVAPAPTAPPAESAAMNERRRMEDKAADSPIETKTGVSAGQVSSSTATYTDAQRKFIRTANAQFRVKDVYQSALAIEDAVAGQGGFVVRNEIQAQTQSTQRRPAGDGKLIELAEYIVNGSLTVRVPSEKTQELLRAIAKEMDFLDQRNFAAMDAQFQLLRQQLAFQRSQQAQQELGDAVRGGDRLDRKADVIAARSTAKLERDEAMIAEKEFEDQIAFSTISLSLYQLPKIRQTELTDVEAVFQKHSPSFFARLGSSLRVGWYGVLDVFIAVMKLWPLWLLAILAVLGYRRLRAARREAV